MLKLRRLRLHKKRRQHFLSGSRGDHQPASADGPSRPQLIAAAEKHDNRCIGPLKAANRKRLRQPAESLLIAHLTAIGKALPDRAVSQELANQPISGKGGPARGSGTAFVIKNGDRFFLASESGDLIIAKLSREGYQEISRWKVLEPTGFGWDRDVVWSHPAFANKCVFARNDKEIVCASLAK